MSNEWRMGDYGCCKVNVLYKFVGGSRGIVIMAFDSAHMSKGEWSTMSPHIGRSNEGVPWCVGNYPVAAGGPFQIVGGFCSMHERDKHGKTALTAEMRYFPKLSGLSDSDMQSRNFEGPFRIYRADIVDATTGTWHLLGGSGGNMEDYFVPQGAEPS